VVREAFTFQGRWSVSWIWRTFRATKHQQNDRKCWKTRELILEDRRRTIHELADTAGISYGVCQEILTENLKMLRIAAKFFPRLLTNDQNQRRVNVCLELWGKANEDRIFISKIIRGDESWIYGYPEAKQQSSQWKSPQSPRAKKVRQFRISTKSMLICSS
jgi:histone-lysine N-methyltransferase SETMAR